jgi:hypothetical protein
MLHTKITKMESGEKENDQEVDRDETDPYNEVIFGRRRPDSVVVDWTNKILLVFIGIQAYI